MSKPYRLAVIGVGAIANMHAKAIADLDNATLVAGSCRSEDKGKTFASTYRCNWHPDYQKMLEAEKPDAVTLCTPSGAHLEPLEHAAKLGIHVLCEKPLEITTARVDKMIATAAKHNIVLGGIFPQRYNPVVQAVHTAAKAGRFGSMALINTYVPWWRDDAYYSPSRWQGKLKWDGGGALMNQSIHGVDAINWIAAATSPDLDPADNPVEQVFAFTARRGHDPKLIEVEDTAVAVLRFRNGALGQILAATSMWPGSLKRLQISGRDGTAEVLEDELVTWKFREELPGDDAIRDKFAAKTSTGGGASDPMAIGYDNHTRNIADFLNAIDEKRTPTIDGKEARKAIAIIEAIYESAASGKAVDVK
jgi:predicted dehydrogenase